MMDKCFLIVLRHAPYGRLDAAEAVRHLSGAVANGLDALALLLEDGVYLARAGQVAAPGWTELSAALAQVLRGSDTRAGGQHRLAVYAHATALEKRGFTEADLIPGCKVVDDATAAELLAVADATLVY